MYDRCTPISVGIGGSWCMLEMLCSEWWTEVGWLRLSPCIWNSSSLLLCWGTGSATCYCDRML